MTKDINNFNFWCPVEISKAIDENTGEELMLLGGIASTADEDSDGEFLDPKGFDIQPLLRSGMVNWHHQAKTCPGTIVGEPTKAEIRKEGLYIETKLYPSSQVAQEIWELAKTLDADSNTRRLGYSIEGRVVSRKSEDKTSPDYKKITKAIITGVAITHQPKNPKTFANIIKGEIDDIEEEDEEEKDDKKKLSQEEEKYYEGVNMKEKSMDTENARPLIKEEVDPKIKVTTFGKAEVMERLFNDIPGISIEKAKKIFNLIKNIANMAKKSMVTEEDITKAYDALGLSPQSVISKGGDNDEDEDFDDSEEDETDEEEEDENVKKGGSSADDDEEIEEDEEEDEEPEDDEDDTEDDEEDEEDEDDNKAEKAMITHRFNRIEKAMATAHLHTAKYIKALGVMIKASQQELEKAVDSLELANDKIEEQNDVIKAQQDEISNLSQRLEAFGSMTPSPKSLRHSNPVERTFGKAQENDIEKGGNSKYQRVSIKNKSAVSDLLDQATFAKGGYDDEFSKACVAFEATGMVDQPIINRMKTEFGVEIVK